MKRFVFQQSVPAGDAPPAAEFFAAATGLPKVRIKDAMNKGAAWLKRKGLKKRRIRRAAFPLRPGDALWLCYDPHLLAQIPPRARCLEDVGRYSVWYKPPGLMTQGTAFGDHCSLLRQVEVFFENRREVYLIHRLDREASGLIVFAHDRQSAGELSKRFRCRQVTKDYRAEVLGDLSGTLPQGRIEAPIDGKPAVTEYRYLAPGTLHNTSLLAVATHSGRLHQIRRHLAGIGHPVMGDPRYGSGNKNSQGMKLTAVGIRFECPYRRRRVVFRLPSDIE